MPPRKSDEGLDPEAIAKRTGNRDRQRAFAGRRLIAEAAALKPGERQCTARRKRDLQRCTQHAIVGGRVCHKHGGSAGQVRKSANLRLLALVEPSLVRLGYLVQQESHLPTALAAIRTVLERAGELRNAIGPLKDGNDGGDSRPVINIGIAVGGIAPPPPAPALPAAIDAELLPEAPHQHRDDEPSKPDSAE